MAELADIELDGETLKRVAGGGCYMDSSKPGPKIKDIMKSTDKLLMFL